jgi:hypothetical protein
LFLIIIVIQGQTEKLLYIIHEVLLLLEIDKMGPGGLLQPQIVEIFLLRGLIEGILDKRDLEVISELLLL